MSLSHHKIALAAAILAAASSCQAQAASARDPVRAVVRSAGDVSIGSDAGTRIVTMPFREGMSFHKNDVLVAFDCARTRAEAKSAEAEWRGHQLVYQNNIGLQKYHAVGKNDVQISEAQMEKARAEADAWSARVEQCEIHAPFDGRVADVFAHVFELPNPANPIVRIVDPDHLEVDMIVPSSAAARIKIGDPFQLAVEEIGETVKGKVVRIGAAVDPVSQTMKIIGALDSDHKAVLPGMSGKADFQMIF